MVRQRYDVDNCDLSGSSLWGGLMLDSSPQDADPSRFEHQGNWHIHRILDPPLDKRSKQMSMGDKDYVASPLPVHVRSLNPMDLIDQRI